MTGTIFKAPFSVKIESNTAKNILLPRGNALGHVVRGKDTLIKYLLTCRIALL